MWAGLLNACGLRSVSMPPNALHVGFDANNVIIRPIGIGLVQKAPQALQLMVELLLDRAFPKIWRSRDQILGIQKLGYEVSSIPRVSCRLGKLIVQYGQLVHVIAGGHLPKQIGRSQNVTDNPLRLSLEGNRAKLRVEARA